MGSEYQQGQDCLRLLQRDSGHRFVLFLLRLRRVSRGAMGNGDLRRAERLFDWPLFRPAGKALRLPKQI